MHLLILEPGLQYIDYLSFCCRCFFLFSIIDSNLTSSINKCSLFIIMATILYYIFVLDKLTVKIGVHVPKTNLPFKICYFQCIIIIIQVGSNVLHFLN